MTVKELMEKLAKCDPDAKCFIYDNDDSAWIELDEISERDNLPHEVWAKDANGHFTVSHNEIAKKAICL